MRFALLLIAPLLLMAVDPQMSSIVSVAPESGNAATLFTAIGENLGKNAVAELYLTDGKNDIKVVIESQAPKEIKFKPPAKVTPGRYSLMILSADKTRMIEQPVKLNIE